MLRRSFFLAIAVCLLASAGAGARAPRPAPLKAPSIAVRLITRDPVAVLLHGRFVVRVDARRTASVRLTAFIGRAVLAPGRTYRIRARRPLVRRVSLPLSAKARKRLRSCSSTVITLIVRARGYGSPGLKTGRHTKLRHRRFVFVCRHGKLVPVSGSGDSGTTPVATPPAGGGGPAGSPGSGTGGGATGGGSTSAPRYEVGTDAETIKPGPDGKWQGQPVYLGGYGFGGAGTVPVQSGRAATGVLGEGPSVRAFAVGDGKTEMAVADIETQGWFAERRTDAYGLVDMRKDIEAATKGNLPATRVIVQSVHSHSGADPMGVWGGVPQTYVKYMYDQTVKAVLTAWFNRAPARLYYGTAPAADLLHNQFDFDPNNQSLDSDMRVLQARDERGRPFATLLNFSAHSTVLGSSNTRISGDWAQAANRMMDQARKPDGTPEFGQGVTMIGTFGRTQPNRDTTPCAGDDTAAGALCKIDGYGKEVVDRARKALAGATEITGTPKVVADSFLIADPATNAPILGFSTIGPEGGAVVGLPFDRSTLPPWQTGNVIGTVTGTARIGDVLISSVPGEIYPQIALKVAGTVKGIRPGGFMTAGLADDQLGYIIAPLEAYPAPAEASLIDPQAQPDQVPDCVTTAGKSCPVEPIGNDNYFFNVSHTLGERVTCSLLRGADDAMGTGSTYWSSYERCPLFVTDHVLPGGEDVAASGPASTGGASHP